MSDEDNLVDPATGAKRVIISVTIQPELLEAVDFLARQQHRNRSNMVEVLVQHGLVAEASYKGKFK